MMCDDIFWLVFVLFLLFHDVFGCVLCDVYLTVKIIINRKEKIIYLKERKRKRERNYNKLI